MFSTRTQQALARSSVASHQLPCDRTHNLPRRPRRRSTCGRHAAVDWNQRVGYQDVHRTTAALFNRNRRQPATTLQGEHERLEYSRQTVAVGEYNKAQRLFLLRCVKRGAEQRTRSARQARCGAMRRRDATGARCMCEERSGGHPLCAHKPNITHLLVEKVATHAPHAHLHQVTPEEVRGMALSSHRASCSAYSPGRCPNAATESARKHSTVRKV